MNAEVAVVRLGKNPHYFREALKQIGSIEDLNFPDRTVVIKVGVFNHTAQNHTSVEVLKAIIDSFTKVPKIHIVESDNYIGKGSERLQIWKQRARFGWLDKASAKSLQTHKEVLYF